MVLLTTEASCHENYIPIIFFKTNILHKWKLFEYFKILSIRAFGKRVKEHVVSLFLKEQASRRGIEMGLRIKGLKYILTIKLVLYIMLIILQAMGCCESLELHVQL